MTARRLTHKSNKRVAKVLRSDARPLLGGGGLVLFLDQLNDSPKDIRLNESKHLFPNSNLRELVGSADVLQYSRDAMALIQASQLSFSERLWLTADSLQPTLLNLSDFGIEYARTELGLPDGQGVLLAQLDPAFSTNQESADGTSGEANIESNESKGDQQGNDVSSESAQECGPADENKGEEGEGDKADTTCEPEPVAETECVAPEEGDEDAENVCDEDGNLVAGAGGGAGIGLAGGGSSFGSSGGGGGAGAGGSAPAASGGGGVSVGGSSAPSVSVSGAVIDGYVAGSFVYADLNGNGIFDNGEPNTTTDEVGAYTFATTASLVGVSIIAEGGIDQDTLAPVEFLKAPAGVTYVTPVSSLAAYATEGITDEAELEASLTSFMTSMNFTFEDLSVDPVVAYDTNPELLEAGASILTAVAASSSLLSGLTGEDEKDLAASFFETLAGKDASIIQAFLPTQDVGAPTSSSVLNDIFTQDFAVDATASQYVADAIGSVVESVRTSDNLDDLKSYASIGQGKDTDGLASKLLTIGGQIKGGINEEVLQALKEDYTTRLDTLVADRKVYLEAKASEVEGISLIRDTITLTVSASDAGPTYVAAFAGPDREVLSSTGLVNSVSFLASELLENDEISIDGVEVVNVKPTDKALESLTANGISWSWDSGSQSVSLGINDPATFNYSSVTVFGDYRFIYETQAPLQVNLVPGASLVVGEGDTSVYTDVRGNFVVKSGEDDSGNPLYDRIYADSSGGALDGEALQSGTLLVEDVFFGVDDQFVAAADFFASVQSGDTSLGNAPGVTISGMFTLQLLPLPDMEIGVNVTVDEGDRVATEILLSDLIPAEGLEVSVGSSLYLDNFLLDGESLAATDTSRIKLIDVDGATIGSGSQLMVKYQDLIDADAYAGLKLSVPGNLAGELTIAAELLGQYGSGVASVEKELAVTLVPTPDGLKSVSGLSDSLVGGIDPDQLFFEDQSERLFIENFASDYLLTQFAVPESGSVLYDADGSEQIALMLGLEAGWTFFESELQSLTQDDVEFILSSGDAPLVSADSSDLGLDWYAFYQSDEVGLLDQIRDLSLLPPANFAGTFNVKAAWGSFEISYGEPTATDLSVRNAPVTLISDSADSGLPSFYVTPRAEDLFFAAQLADQSNKVEGSDEIDPSFVSFTLAVSDLLPSDIQTGDLPEGVEPDPAVSNLARLADHSGEEQFSLVLEIPNMFFVSSNLDLSEDDQATYDALVSGGELVVPGWARLGPGSAENTSLWQTIGDFTLSNYLNGYLPDLILKPKRGTYTDPEGVTVQIVGTSFVDETDLSSVKTISTQNGDSTLSLTLIVKPDIDSAGSVAATSASASLTESQGDTDGWLSFADFMDIDATAPNEDTTVSLVFKVKASDVGQTTPELELGIDRGSGISNLASASNFTQFYAVTDETDAVKGYAVVDTLEEADQTWFVYEVDLAGLDASAVYIKGQEFLHLDSFEASAEILTRQQWGGDFIEKSSALVWVDGVIESVASGLGTDLTVRTGVAFDEDKTVSGVQGHRLSEFVDSAAIALDSSEQLFYEFILPEETYLRDSGAIRGGQVVDVADYIVGASDDLAGRLYRISSSQLDSDRYHVDAPEHFFGTMDFYARAVSVEPGNNDESAGDWKASQFTINAVSDKPTVIGPSDMVKLLVDTLDDEGAISVLAKLKLPVIVSAKDTSEALDVVLRVTAADGTLPSSLDLSGLSFYVDNNGSTVALSFDAATGVVSLPSGVDVSAMGSMWVTSTKDYRGDSALKVSIDAGSTAVDADGNSLAARSGNTDKSFSLEIYKPVGVPKLTLAESASDVIDLLIGMPSSSGFVTTGLSGSAFSVLMTGVPEDAWFGDTDGSLGANLGDGIWLFTGTELFGESASLPLAKELQFNDITGSIPDTMSVKVLVNDSTGGTSNNSGAFVPANTPIDPVVIQFGNGELDYQFDPLVFDYFPESEGDPRDELVYSWLTGDAASKAGSAYLVQSDDSVAIVSDSFTGDLSMGNLFSGETELAALDVSTDGVVSMDELSGVYLWFDQANSGSVGSVDAGELVSIDGLGYSKFDITLSAIVDADGSEFSGQDPAGTGLGVMNLGSVAVDVGNPDVVVAAHFTGLPFSTLSQQKTSTLFPAEKVPAVSDRAIGYQDGATFVASSTIDEDQSIFLDFDFDKLVVDSVNPEINVANTTIVNLVKLYGVPSNANLIGFDGVSAIFVEGDPNVSEDQGFWILALPESEDPDAPSQHVNAELRFIDEHVTGDIKLYMEPLVSVTESSEHPDTGLPVIVSETILGSRIDLGTVVINPLAEEALTIEVAGVKSLEIDERDSEGGGEIDLSLFDIIATSPDPQEADSLFIHLGLVESDTLDSESPVYYDLSATLGDSSLKYLNGITPASGVLEFDGNYAIVSQDQLANLRIELEQFDNTNVTLIGYPLSRHGTTESQTTSELEFRIPITVNPKANGVDSVALSVQTPDSLTEGDPILVDLTSLKNDASEWTHYTVKVGGSSDFLSSFVTFDSRRGYLDAENNYRVFDFYESSETPTAQDTSFQNLALIVDDYFSGDITFEVSATTIDPASGLESVLALAGSTVYVSVAGNAGNVDLDNQPTSISDVQLTQLVFDETTGTLLSERVVEDVLFFEGVKGGYKLAFTQFDLDETFSIFSDPVNEVVPEHLTSIEVIGNRVELTFIDEDPQRAIPEVATTSIDDLVLRIIEGSDDSADTFDFLLDAFDLTIEKTAKAPVFEYGDGVEPFDRVRIELEEGVTQYLLSDAVPLVPEDQTDDILHYELSQWLSPVGTADIDPSVIDLSTKVKLSDGLVINSGGLDENNRAYLLTPAMISSVTVTALAGLFTDTAEAQYLVWEAVHTEGDTGDYKRSTTQVGVNLTEKIHVSEGFETDSYVGDWLFVAGKTNTFTLDGGVSSDVLTVTATVADSAVAVESLIPVNDVADLGSGGGEFQVQLTTPVVAESLGSEVTVEVNYQTDEALGAATGTIEVVAKALPDMGSWTTADAMDAFGTGYLADDYEATQEAWLLENPDQPSEPPMWFAQVDDSDPVGFISPDGFVVIDPGFLRDDDPNTVEDESSAVIGFSSDAGDIELSAEDFANFDKSYLHGTDANDLIMADTETASVLFGAGGNNEIFGSAQDDLIIAGESADLIHSGDGNDIIQVVLKDGGVEDIVSDAFTNEQNYGEMEFLLDAMLGQYSDRFTPTEGLGIAQPQEGDQSSLIFQAIQAVHKKAFDSGVDENHLSFKGVVDDYARGDDAADRLVYTSGSQETETTLEAYEIGTVAETWGGSSSLIYSIAQSFDELTTANGVSVSETYTSMILMTEYAANTEADGLIIDLEAAGISAI